MCIIYKKKKKIPLKLKLTGLRDSNMFDFFFFLSFLSDDAEKFTSEMHDPCARSRCLQKRTTQKHLTEGAGVELAKHPPKVKSEIFLQL